MHESKDYYVNSDNRLFSAFDNAVPASDQTAQPEWTAEQYFLNPPSAFEANNDHKQEELGRYLNMRLDLKWIEDNLMLFWKEHVKTLPIHGTLRLPSSLYAYDSCFCRKIFQWRRAASDGPTKQPFVITSR